MKSEPKSKKTNIADILNKNPDEKNWKEFQKVSKKDDAKYYRIFYPSGLKDKSALLKSYATIYDSHYRSLYSVPIFMKKGKVMEGATIYLKDLELNRKVK